MQIKTIYLYPDRTDVTLTAYLIDDSIELLCGKSRPAVIICPGGGYLNCSDREAEPVAIRFAAMGYHAFVLRYSVYAGVTGKFPGPKDKTVPDERYALPSQMRELGMAILKIRENADAWLVNPDQICICGFSAGGHNCAMYAAYWAKPVITEYFKVEKERLRPNAMILSYAAVDYISGVGPKNPFDMAMTENMHIVLFGKEPAKVTEEERLFASPCRLVDENTPPAFIWATASDQTVPIRNSLEMAQALAAQNIPFEIHIFENGHHGLSLGTQASAYFAGDKNADVAKWVTLAEAWLEKRFNLPVLDELPPPPFELE